MKYLWIEIPNMDQMLTWFELRMDWEMVRKWPRNWPNIARKLTKNWYKMARKMVKNNQEID